jgi:hypothetical protein
VFAFVGKDGAPRACPVTPYVVGDRAVVSSTLAFTGKVAAVRSSPNVALLAGGWLARGAATLDIDLTSRTFDQQVRAQELRKYPPSRQLLWLPGHRRLLWWYVGRAAIRIPLGDGTPLAGPDTVTATFVDAGTPRIVPLAATTDLAADELPVPAEVRGPTVVLAHHEDDQMSDLRQLTLRGTAGDGIFRVLSRTGTLAPSHPSTLDQLSTLRYLASEAKRHRRTFERWTAHERTAL